MGTGLGEFGYMSEGAGVLFSLHEPGERLNLGRFVKLRT